MSPKPETGLVAKELLVVTSGIEMFTRHGFAKTTMGDIARGAGISRPALYLLFPDKEAVFERVVASIDDAKHLELADILAGPAPLGDRLLAACLSWGLHGVELAEAHPAADDLFDLRFPSVRQVYARFEALIAKSIESAAASAISCDTPEDLARTLVYGMRGLRAIADDTREMRRLVTIHVRVFLQAIAIDRQPEPGGAQA